MKKISFTSAFDRKKWYRLHVEHYLKQIPQMQAQDGSFKMGIEPLYNPEANARLQEGVLPLVWHMSRFGTENFIECIRKGIIRLSQMQLDNGAFPETEGESFAATAFIVCALLKILELGNPFLPDESKNTCKRLIKRSLPFLAYEDKIVYTNQLAAGLSALKESGKIFPMDDGILRKRLKTILGRRDISGLFQEGEGIDLGYSTLTYSLLSTFDKSRDFYGDFIKTLSALIFPDGTHILPMSRTHGWIVLNALESASRFYPKAAELAGLHIKAHESGLCDATHIISKRHILTTLFRICEAYDNCQVEASPTGEAIDELFNIRSKYLKIFRGEKIIALFYLSKYFLGYSFYLGPGRILFGTLRNTRLKEKRERFTAIRKKVLFSEPLRTFILNKDNLVIENFSGENIFSVGRFMPEAGMSDSFSTANQNIFKKEDIFVNNLSAQKKYIFYTFAA